MKNLTGQQKLDQVLKGKREPRLQEKGKQLYFVVAPPANQPTKPVTTKQEKPQETTERATLGNTVALLVLTGAAVAVAGSALGVLHTAIAQPGLVSWGRALAPLGCEAILGHIIFELWMGQQAKKQIHWAMRTVATLACVALIGVAVKAELVAATAAPQVAARKRQADILGHAAHNKVVGPVLQQASGEGKRGLLKLQQVNEKLVTLTIQNQDSTKSILAEQLKLAQEVLPQEAEQAKLTAILGAISSSAVIVLLKLLLEALASLVGGRKVTA